jgi:hypothetical protein
MNGSRGPWFPLVEKRDEWGSLFVVVRAKWKAGWFLLQGFFDSRSLALAASLRMTRPTGSVRRSEHGRFLAASIAATRNDKG